MAPIVTTLATCVVTLALQCVAEGVPAEGTLTALAPTRALGEWPDRGEGDSEPGNASVDWTHANASNGSAPLKAPARGLAAQAQPSLPLGPLVGISSGVAGNLAIAGISTRSCAIAFEDYTASRVGVLSTCTLSVNNSLSCTRRGAFTSGAVHYASGSLAIAGLQEDSQVLIAWRSGVAPFYGQVRWFTTDLRDSSLLLSVPIQWGRVAVAVLYSTLVTYAYTDAKRGHRGSIALCKVEGANLNCQGAVTFESALPVGALALAALADAPTVPPYAASATDLVVAYEAGSDSARGVRIQACEVVQGTLQCYAQSRLIVLNGPSDGLSILSLSASAFVLAYADRLSTCGATRTNRRRALDVCTASDGHPSIGRARMCKASFRLDGIAGAQLECASANVVVDDGYRTETPQLARGTGNTSFLAAYACYGCADLGSRGLVRACNVTSDPTGKFYWALACGNATEANSYPTLGIGVAAVGAGYAVAYDGDGDRRLGTVRYVR